MPPGLSGIHLLLKAFLLNKSLFIRKTQKLSGFRTRHLRRGAAGVDLSLWSPAWVTRAGKPVLALASKLTTNLLDDVVHRTGLPLMPHFDRPIRVMHLELLDNDRGPNKRLPRVPASAANRIEFTIRHGNSPTGFAPPKRARSALTLHPQFTERENGVWEFPSEKPGNLWYRVEKLWRFLPRLTVSGRVNAHSSFRDEWLIRVEQLRSNLIRGIVKTVSYAQAHLRLCPCSLQSRVE
jgi:hypothetical protein